jgi:UDP-N-acetylmuramoyl-tripeptide--D-alanyl-D-alanine ligase
MLIDVLLWIVAAVWSAGTLVRIYRQARFFQIEEYMSLRYLRWLFALRTRWLPNRPTVAFGAAALFSLLMTESSDGIFPALINLVAASIAAIPPDEGEIKKAFRPTPRARRLLAVAFALATLAAVIGTAAAATGIRIESAPEVRFVLVALVGLVVHLLAPLALIVANILLMPVEGALRGRFVAQARRVLAEIDPVVIGITGSYGKTSTKTYLTHILNGRYKAYATPKSYNTMMGVCIAINNDLANDYSVEYFVCEMGAYIPGEIARICDLTHPKISLVVEVGPQHLERFGSLENIAIAKYEIIKALPPDGLGVFNWDNPYVREMYERGYPANRIAVSREADPAAEGDTPRLIASEVSESLNALRFRVTDKATDETALFNVPLLGLHNVTNILMSTAVALHEGMTLAEVARRASTLQPAESRLTRQVDARGITILNDAYSANPVSVGHALRVLSMHTGGRRLLITPGMVELGELMEQENKRLGEIAAQHATDIILIGEKQTAPIAAGLRDADYPAEQVQVMQSVRDAIAWYERNLGAGDTVLFLNDLPDTYSS